MSTTPLSKTQQTMLVVLRTLIGWHFLYEGYTKLLSPAWGQNGVPIRAVVVGRVSESGDGTARAALPLDGKRIVDRLARSRR